jgi:hypothetical protein
MSDVSDCLIAGFPAYLECCCLYSSQLRKGLVRRWVEFYAAAALTAGTVQQVSK